MSTTVPPAANDPAPPQLVKPGKSLSAGAGTSWIGEGWALFTKAPLMWIVLLVLMFIIMIIMSLFPIVGQMAVQILSPVFAAGFMLGCWSLENGGELELEHIFAGFKRQFGTLAVVGVITLVGGLVILLVCAMLVGFSIIPVILQGGDDPAAAMAALAAMGGTLAIGVLLASGLGVLLMAAYWFAPVLVVMHGMGAVDAMKASFFACFRNFVPFLVYGIVMFLLCIVAAIPFGLGFLVLVPVAIASTFRAYRQIFTE